jgi:uncharacterized protein
MKKLRKKILWAAAIGFILMNVVAFFHAYKFTHFAKAEKIKTKSPGKLSTGEKISTLIFGVNNPRPVNNIVPAYLYQTVFLNGAKKIECWEIKKDSVAKGTVVIFHGYSGNKASMLDKADEFLNLDFNVLLVDFIGSGGSEGHQTTLGFKEAADVKVCFDYLKNKAEKNIILFGTSMGAVAILKAIDAYKITPQKIILECPFGSMYQTTAARFRNMNVPAFPMAGLLVFWGGVQNGFWAFGHNPVRYAKSVTCPVLLLYGEKDDNVSRKEIDDIYRNINGRKDLKTYADAGHENYLLKYHAQWTQDVKLFLQSEN